MKILPLATNFKWIQSCSNFCFMFGQKNQKEFWNISAFESKFTKKL